jgi:hypothetical protein
MKIVSNAPSGFGSGFSIQPTPDDYFCSDLAETVPRRLFCGIMISLRETVNGTHPTEEA